MWAQLISFDFKPGKEAELSRLVEHLQKIEQPESGLIREVAMSDQKNPTRAYVLAIFESEEKARQRENDPRRSEGAQVMRALMADVLEGAPEFVDLNVVAEYVL